MQNLETARNLPGKNHEQSGGENQGKKALYDTPEKDHYILLENTAKTFRSDKNEFIALKAVNLAVRKGEYTAVTGKSGSGKSTLINMISGIDHPDSGRVCIYGIDIHKLNESQLSKWRGENVGIVFQFFQLIPTLTVIENILLAMEFVGKIPKKERLSRCEFLLEEVGIPDHGNKLPSALSGGEQQRAAIARALANDPPIIVADEPTGNLDSRTSGSIHKLFRRLVEKEKTVIVITHEDVRNNDYERIITLQDGEIIFDSKGA